MSKILFNCRAARSASAPPISLSVGQGSSLVTVFKVCLSIHQHWFPTRLRSFPSALLPVDQQLHLQSPVHHAPKFVDDTTLIGLISGGDESAYRQEIDHLATWCSHNNLELNALKTVDMVVDFRKNAAPPAPITLGAKDNDGALLHCHHSVGVHPASPSGTLLPLPRTSAVCSISFALLRR